MNSRAKQFRFSDSSFKVQDRFGGSLSKKRCGRVARPVSTRDSMHLILKSSLAKGDFSFRAKDHAARIEASLRKNSARFGVELIRFSNNHNHLHLHVRFGSRDLYKRFVRSVSGHIAMIVTGANKTKPLAKIIGQKSFWDERPFSRVVHGRRGFRTANDYVRLNQLEAEDAIPKRSERLRGVKPGERRYFIQPKKPTSDSDEPQLAFL